MKHLLHAPLLKIAVCFMAGIVMAQFFGAAVALLAVPSGLAFLALLALDRKLVSRGWEAAVAICIGLTAAGLGGLRYNLAQPPREMPVAEFINCSVAHIQGRVLAEPKESVYGRRVWVELLAFEQKGQMIPASGRIQLYLEPENQTLVQAHDTILAEAEIRDANSKYAGYLTYLNRNGIYHYGYVKQLSVSGEASGLLHLAGEAQSYISARLGQLIPDSVSSGIAQAMYIGDTGQLDPEIRQDFSETGTSHVLSISGMHVGIVYLFLDKVLSLFGITLLSGGRRIKNVFIIAILLAYMLITGATAPVVRSVLMFGSILFFRTLWQRYHMLNVLGSAALLQMLIEPAVVSDLGFQLSYLAVLGIVVFVPMMESWGKHKNKVLQTLSSWVQVTLAATLATLPLIIWNFGQFPTWFILSNVLVAAIGSLLVLSGFLLVCFCWLPYVAEFLGMVSQYLLQLLQIIVSGIADLPWALIRSSSDPQAWMVLLAQLLVAAALLASPALAARLKAA
ncbi:MAG: ComEC family competence protein [Bacteroidetes bacterium]|nr:MAG: ComEC family competence protein [Bacteroidota bacterium]